MNISREAFREFTMRYWADSPEVERDGCVVLVDDWAPAPSFPDLTTLTPAEKDLLRPVLQGRPDILQFEITVKEQLPS